MAKIKTDDIKNSLIDQLVKKGADVDCFRDQIDSYIFYTEMERKMQTDINKKGLSYKAISATGKEYMKDNPSIKNAVMYNKQRLAILAQLGLTIKTVEMDCDDDL